MLRQDVELKIKNVSNMYVYFSPFKKVIEVFYTLINRATLKVRLKLDFMHCIKILHIRKTIFLGKHNHFFT